MPDELYGAGKRGRRPPEALIDLLETTGEKKGAEEKDPGDPPSDSKED
jgi:hypothetical protein